MVVTTALTTLNSSSTNAENVDERRFEFDKAYDGLWHYYKDKRLVFSRDTAKRIEILIETLKQTSILCVSNVAGSHQGDKFERRLSDIEVAMTTIRNLCRALRG